MRANLKHAALERRIFASLNRFMNHSGSGDFRIKEVAIGWGDSDEYLTITPAGRKKLRRIIRGERKK